VQAALSKEATLRLARFERLETWNGLVPGDQVRIAGHRGGTWRFRAFVTNTSNGASWIEVSEVLGARRRTTKAAPGAEEEGGSVTTVTRTRSFRPELVTPVRKTRRRRSATLRSRPAASVDGPGVQASLFDEEDARD
jgi:hypothetical protein